MSTLRTYRDLLSNRPLTRLLGGEFVSAIGDWLYLVALLIVVYERSHDAVLLGIVGAARVLPYVLLSVPAGIAADRFERRMVLLVTDIARGVVMLGLAWLVATDGPIEGIVGLAIFATCFSTFFGPSIGAYLPSLVEDERQLGPANSAWSTLDNLAFFLGPALGGILVATGGLTLAFLLNAGSFAIIALVLWRLPASSATRDTGRAAGAEKQVQAVPEAAPTRPSPAARPPIAPIVGLTLMEAVGSFAMGGIGVLTVVLSTTVYDSGEAGTGFLSAAIGLGGLSGAVLSGALVLRPRLGPVLVSAAAGMAVGLVALGIATNLPFGFIALTAASAGSIVLEVVSRTLFQRAVPDAIRGRALGVMFTVIYLSYSAGSFLIPVLSDRFGIPAVLGAGGLAVGLAAAVGRALVGSSASREASPYEATLGRVATLPIFAGVSPARLEAALGRLRPQPVAAGEQVIRQGDPADLFYVIASGRFLVTQHRADGTEHILRDMGPDEVFGEIGLLRSSPRTATVTALDDGLLLALNRADFLELVASESGLGSRLLDLRRAGTGADLRAEAAGVSAS